MKELFKKILSKQQRLRLQVIKRYITDRGRGYYAKMNKAYLITPQDLQKDFLYTIQTAQRITPSSSLAQKLNNLRLAAQKISYVCIPPKAIFSFWKWVGEPTEKQGFMQSRSILQGIVQNEMGGGLCQLSGILHYLILETGFLPLERHSHSIDIYTEEERFAPLGTDATVAYGYKDFRFINTFATPIVFSFLITDTSLQVLLHSQIPLKKCHLAYQREEKPPHRIVKLYRDSQLVLTSSYLIA